MTADRRVGGIGLSLILLIIAIVLFILAALGVPDIKGISLGWFGLAFFAAAHI